MDFDVVGIDGLVASETGFSPLASEAETGQKGLGSGYSKQGRSGLAADEWRSFKMAKSDTMLRSSLFSQEQPQLLSFSVAEKSLQNGSFGVYHSSGAYGRNSGLGAGGLSGSMHGVFAGIRGPFTPSQWMELEHQALIYKHLNANVPIPSNLLMSIRRSFNPVGESIFAPESFRSNQLRWGSFHLSFSGNTDAEPGRCRRTDGKKWRCSRDAVADQKYCERHLNRGRHRSRKPVECQSGHTVSGPASAVGKTLSVSSAAVTGLSSSASNNLSIAHQQPKSINMSADPSATHISRISLNKPSRDNQLQDSQSLSFGNMSFPVLKTHAPLEESSRTEFGLFSSNSVLSPIRSPYIQNPCFNSSHEDQEPQSHPLRDFIDNWQGRQSEQLSLSWPEVEDTQSDKMQLSMSIPVSDFSSSSSSLTQEKLTLSPLRAPGELDSIQMNLGLGDVLNDSSQRQANWRPISWEASMGGPLGEVLNNSNNSPGGFKTTMSLMTDRWVDSPRLESSPTGVLQKATFVSLSNSSTASSPRAENSKSNDFSTSFGDDLLGPDLVNSSIASL